MILEIRAPAGEVVFSSGGELRFGVHWSPKLRGRSRWGRIGGGAATDCGSAWRRAVGGEGDENDNQLGGNGRGSRSGGDSR